MSDPIKDNFKKQCDDVVSYMQTEFSSLQIGRAHAGLVENIMVDVYGSKTPMKGVASIVIADAKTITIQPWDKGNLGPVEKAIQIADIGLNPINDGVVVRIVMPELTGERREQLVKLVHEYMEKAKISIRQHRQDAHQKIKEQEKNKEITEDDLRRDEKMIQEAVDEWNKKVEELGKRKEEDIKTV